MDCQNRWGWSHPVHAHFEEAIILSVDGHDPPEWERWAREDMFRLGPENDGAKNIEIAIHFREFAGSYMEHCHNTQHEDRSMLQLFDVEHPGQILTMPAPMPTWGASISSIRQHCRSSGQAMALIFI